MDVRMSVEPLDGATRHGWRATLDVRIENPGPDLLLLDDLVADGPHDDRVRWRRPPDGAIVYDAIEDCYRHLSVTSMRSPIPVDHGLVPARAAAQTLLQIKSLATGTRRVRLVARGHVLPQAEVGARVYAPAEGIQGSVTVFEPVGEGAAARGSVVVRRGGLAPFEVALELDVEVAPDAASLASAALAAVGPGARLVDRLRRLGGAWVIEAEDGATHLVAGARSLRLPRGTVVPPVWRGLDERMPFDPVLVMFRGEAAAAARAGLPLLGKAPQHALASAAVWDLLARVAERRLTLAWGRHSALNEGLIIA